MARLAGRGLTLLCVVRSTAVVGHDGNATCSQLVARQRLEIALLRAEVRALRGELRKGRVTQHQERSNFGDGDVELLGAHSRNRTRALASNLSVGDVDLVETVRSHTRGLGQNFSMDLLEASANLSAPDLGFGGFASSEILVPCPAGWQQHMPGCLECPVGQFSPEGELCETCEDGTVAELKGSSACVACRVWESADTQATACFIAPEKAVLPTMFLLSAGAFCAMLVQVVRMRVHLRDVSLEEGHTVVTSNGSHRLSNFGRRSFPVTLRDTGHPNLDSPSKHFQARVRDAVRLELLTQEGDSIKNRLDTSMGVLTVGFPAELYHRGWGPVPAAYGLALLLVTAVGLGGAVLTAEMAEVALPGAAVAALVGTAVSLAVRVRPRPTPLTLRLAEFKLKLEKQLDGSTRRRDKGPDRAISLGKLRELLDSFRDFIRDRTAYFITSNLIKPLTKDLDLSYAEFVGAEQVEWFVSHFWGTAFEHFCTALQKHAETVCGQGDWRALRYWVCFCSNNQHHVEEELGSGWQESSFYITLTSGLCRGTCMVLDDQAQPLTRLWCIFELVQTVKLERSLKSFQGLLLCTSSGVLNRGSGSVDVATALAQRVADMDLATAEASRTSDADMIRGVVVREMGSFAVLKGFVHHAVPFLTKPFSPVVVLLRVRNMLAHAQQISNQKFAAVLARLQDVGGLPNIMHAEL